VEPGAGVFFHEMLFRTFRLHPFIFGDVGWLFFSYFDVDGYIVHKTRGLTQES